MRVNEDEHLSVCVCVCLAHTLCVCVCVCLAHTLCVCVSCSHSVCVCVSFSHSVCVCIPIGIYFGSHSQLVQNSSLGTRIHPAYSGLSQPSEYSDLCHIFISHNFISLFLYFTSVPLMFSSLLTVASVSVTIP